MRYSSISLCAIMIFLVGCQRRIDYSKTNSKINVSCPVGEHVYHQQMIGFIYGNIKTGVKILRCNNAEMDLTFIGDPPEQFSKLRHIASSDSDIISFKADANGYIVRDGVKLTFVAVGLDNVTKQAITTS